TLEHQPWPPSPPWEKSVLLLLLNPMPTSAGLKTLLPVPTYEDVSIPEKSKLKFVERVPLVPKVRREPENLSDIQGPSTEASEFTKGNFAILALGGGFLRWDHFEMMHLTINHSMDPKNMFPITCKGIGQRMGGGKGAIDHYVTPVKAGRLIVQHFLRQVAHKLPFPAKAVSRESLEKMRKDQEERERNNQNPWTSECIATANTPGIRKVLSPYDLTQKGQYWANSTVTSGYNFLLVTLNPLRDKEWLLRALCSCRL
uniref:Large ribosomal subunit protein uL16m n=1 Tax=Sciurus vulgaris TaxID=55149 RepID=A0A8D2DGW6_SCIVU